MPKAKPAPIKNRVTIAVCLKPATAAALKQYADSNERSVSYSADHLITKALKTVSLSAQ